jgi:galactokinase
MQATCMHFYRSIKDRGIELKLRSGSSGFKLSYDTTIPRQSGLSGSSAIICATFNCLLRWFRLEDQWPIRERPQFALDIETHELGIAAGIVDRVAQV